jgi:hypothetical protein
MRFFLFIEVVVGALFIIFGLVLQTPPKASVPIGLIVLGGLTLINSFFGCIGSCYKRALLTLYLIIGTILTVAQAVLVFYIFGKETTVATRIARYDNSSNLDLKVQDVRHDLNYIKWILLVFVILEIVSLLIAFVMRCCVDPDGHYGNFEDEEARYNTQMNTMPNSSGNTGKAYDSQSSSIASKYGMYKK